MKVILEKRDFGGLARALPDLEGPLEVHLNEKDLAKY
jgi:hypothetical protein